jgi:DNA-binding CsgD family transcriptional regulator
MNTPANQGLPALSEKERQTLRLIVRGHDAKSVARSLGLSVHTINERLRDARRKLAVSSSREAARILLEAEGGLVAPPAPDLSVDATIGADPAAPRVDQGIASIDGAGRTHRRPWLILGGSVMTLALGLLIFAAMPQTVPAPPSPADTALATPDSEVVDTARQWLALLDQSRWEDSYRATGAAFRKLNTAKVWAAASERARAPLGGMVSRTFVSQEDVPAPPAGYQMAKFRTRFANKSEAIETVTLNRESGGWHVVGVTIG